jgi:hypothetical protein
VSDLLDPIWAYVQDEHEAIAVWRGCVISSLDHMAAIVKSFVILTIDGGSAAHPSLPSLDRGEEDS